MPPIMLHSLIHDQFFLSADMEPGESAVTILLTRRGSHELACSTEGSGGNCSTQIGQYPPSLNPIEGRNPLDNRARRPIHVRNDKE